MNESKFSLKKVARQAMVVVALLAALAALQAFSAQPAQALCPVYDPCIPGGGGTTGGNYGAPYVTSLYPANNATGIAPGANVTATFSEAMNASTINTTTFNLKRAGTSTNLSATVTYDSATKRATLNPTSNLQSGIRYVATVTTGAKDLSGTPLDQYPTTAAFEAKTWTFTVGSRSQGVYRIPYQTGTTVKVSRDFYDHDPPGRVDLYDTDDENGRIVAAADGVIRRIEDGFSKNRPGQYPCNNNYVWIEHANGEWTKYSHMSQDSVTQDAGLSVGERVSAGQFLGDESNVGCASGIHLHFEVAELIPTTAARTFGDTIDSEGFIDLSQARNLVPRICGLPGEEFNTGASYVARSC